MRLFLISLNWCLNYLFFRIILLGNRRVLSGLESKLFKVVPLKPVRPYESNIALEVEAEYEIPATPHCSYMLQHAHSTKIYAGDRNAKPEDYVVVPIRIFCPVKAKKVLIVGKYTTLSGRAGKQYTDQEFSDIKPGWFDGVLFVKFNYY